MRVPDGSGLTLQALLDRRAAPLLAAPLLAALAVGIGAILAGFAVGSDLAEQANLAARWTARVALPFFLIAFTARALVRLWPGTTMRAVLQRRRQWGLGFAVAHAIHLGALWFNITVAAPVAVRLSQGDAFAQNVPGAVIFLFIIAMAATSNDASVRRLRQWWGRLHTLGAYAIWAAFTATYAGRIALDDPGMQRTGMIFTPLMLAALALRLWGRFGSPRRA